MYDDHMHVSWRYQIDVPKADHDLNDLIDYCGGAFGQNFYSWKLHGQEHYRFFFNLAHHMRAFKNKVSNAVVTEAAVEKPATLPSIAVATNGKRVSISFKSLSQRKVQELGEQLVQLCYEAERIAAEAETVIVDWSYEQFREAVIQLYETVADTYHGRLYAQYIEDIDEDRSEIENNLVRFIEQKGYSLSQSYLTQVIADVFLFRTWRLNNEYTPRDIPKFMEWFDDEFNPEYDD